MLNKRSGGLRVMMVPALALMVGLMSGVAYAGDHSDVLGTWTLESPGRDGQKRSSTLIITEESGVLKAKTISDRGTYEPKQVTYDNGELKMVFEFDRDGRTINFERVAKPNGDQLTGVTRFEFNGQSREFEFTGRRIAKPQVAAAGADVIGDWTLKLTVGDGRVVETGLKLHRVAGELAGKSISQRFGEREISDAKYENGTLSWTVKFTGQDGNDYPIKYSADVTGSSMKGRVEFDFQGNVRTMNFEGTREDKKA